MKTPFFLKFNIKNLSVKVSNVEPIDRVKKMDRDGNYFVPMGHYALSNSKNIHLTHNPKLSIYGLGSCIALVLLMK